MLRAADALRLSSDVQEAFGQAERSGGVLEWMDLVEPLVERPLLRAYGVADINSGLVRMRYEPNAHPELRQLAHWFRYNRAAAVPFGLGDVAPNAHVQEVMDLCPMDDTWSACITTTHALMRNVPTLFVASSRS